MHIREFKRKLNNEMKFRKEFLVVILLLSIICIECSNNNSDSYTYIANHVESRIVIDGLLDEKAWTNREKVALKKHHVSANKLMVAQILSIWQSRKINNSNNC